MDDLKDDLLRYDEEDMVRIMVLDLPFYNILLNIEEICVETEEIELVYCGLATKTLIDFYIGLPQEKRRDFNYLKNQIENELTKIDLYNLLEVLQDNNILGDWFALYQRMYGRLEYMVTKYETE